MTLRARAVEQPPSALLEPAGDDRPPQARRLRGLLVALDQGRAGTLFAAMGLGLAYAALATVVTVISPFVNAASTAASFWPAAGLTSAALLSSPYRRWPWFLLTIFLVEAGIDRLMLGVSMGASLGWALANTIEPLVGAVLVRRLIGTRLDLARRDHLFAFLVCAVGVGPLVGATIGSLTNDVTGTGGFIETVGRWLIGDGVGVLVLAPALLTAFQPGPKAARGGLILVALICLSAFAPASLGFPGLPLPYLAMPVVVWLAIVGRTAVASRTVLLLAIIVDGATIAGVGPFAERGAYDGLLSAQFFLAVTGISALLVASLASELLTRDAVEARLRIQATHDALTGLPNRELLLSRLDEAARAGRPVSLGFVDLNDFKDVNDSLGHHVGDRVLEMVAERLASRVRADDLLARIGGDEFAVLLTGEDPAGIADRLLDALREPFVVDDEVLHVSASIGLASSHDGTGVEGLLRRADEAMYAAKRGGRGSQVLVRAT